MLLAWSAISLFYISVCIRDNLMSIKNSSWIIINLYYKLSWQKALCFKWLAIKTRTNNYRNILCRFPSFSFPALEKKIIKMWLLSFSPAHKLREMIKGITVIAIISISRNYIRIQNCNYFPLSFLSLHKFTKTSQFGEELI